MCVSVLPKTERLVGRMVLIQYTLLVSLLNSQLICIHGRLEYYYVTAHKKSNLNASIQYIYLMKIQVRLFQAAQTLCWKIIQQKI